MTYEEFEDLLNRYETDVYSLCLRLGRSRDEADELFQETWLDAIEHIQQIDNEKNPKSYLMGKTISIWKAKRRKYARRQKIALVVNATEEMEEVCFVSGQATPEEAVLEQEIYDCLKQEVRALKEKYRVVIELYYSLGLPAKEIAEILHIPQGTVESRLYKARKVLQSKMEGHGYEIQRNK